MSILGLANRAVGAGEHLPHSAPVLERGGGLVAPEFFGSCMLEAGASLHGPWKLHQCEAFVAWRPYPLMLT